MKKLLFLPFLVLSMSFVFAFASSDPKSFNPCDQCKCADCCQDNSCCKPDCYDACKPCPECEICQPCCKPCCTEAPKTGEPCNCAYNGPARIDPACGWDAWISASFIYWQAKEGGAIKLGYHYLIPSEIESHVYPINGDFDYHPGFKIGAGFSMCRDDWTLYLEYTRLKSKAHSVMTLQTVMSIEQISCLARLQKGKLNFSI